MLNIEVQNSETKQVVASVGIPQKFYHQKRFAVWGKGLERLIHEYVMTKYDIKLEDLEPIRVFVSEIPDPTKELA